MFGIADQGLVQNDRRQSAITARWLRSPRSRRRHRDISCSCLSRADCWTRFPTALFDVDGTLIDSNDAHTEAWVQSLREHNIPAEMSRIRPLIGKGGDK